MASVSTIIQYSSQDAPFIGKCILECKKFSRETAVITFDRQFDGQPEPTYYHHNPEVKIYRYELPEQGIDAWQAHSIARNINHVSNNCDYVLLLDADEIPDGNSFSQFINSIGSKSKTYKMANFVYYKDPTYRAIAIQDSIMLVDRRTPYNPFCNLERDRDRFVDKDTIRQMTHKDRVMFHHYSWAKPRKTIEQKIKTWGHKNDRDWNEILRTWDNFNENSIDPVWGYEYVKVDNTFNIKL